MGKRVLSPRAHAPEDVGVRTGKPGAGWREDPGFVPYTQPLGDGGPGIPVGSNNGWSDIFTFTKRAAPGPVVAAAKTTSASQLYAIHGLPCAT